MAGRRFGGFLVATDPAVAVPHAFFTDVLPQIGEVNELHVTLTFFRLTHELGGFEVPISDQTLRRDRALRQALRVPGSPREPDRQITNGLELAISRGTFLCFVAEQDSEQHIWYYVNTPVNAGLIGAMTRGAIAPPEAVWRDGQVPSVRAERPNVFRGYEQNIGLLTPLIADQLVDALETYPVEWIEDAISEAVSYNRRSWRYIQRILEQWAATGRSSGQGGADRWSANTRPRPSRPTSIQSGESRARP